ncbi:putative motility protein [Pontibacter sp. JAM-7]|uniref:putative motility protein n=1 Tax=Pontibacter sp. JAM-7 TaxID=3366581 RepID=UPI003AF445D2
MEVSGIANLATAMSQQAVQTELAVKSVDMANDMIEAQGEMMLQLLQVAGQTQLSLDPLSSLGTQIDVMA